MEFFDKLGKKATEAYKVTADKTGKIAKETKIKFKIGELKGQISDIYEEIGKRVYEKHVAGEKVCIKKDLEEQCTKIDVLSDEIDSLLKQCLELNDKRQCPKCFAEIDKESKFCPKCGEKQEEATETEIAENTSEPTETVETSDLNNETTENNKSSETLEKTVEVESDVKTQEVVESDNTENTETEENTDTEDVIEDEEKNK